MRLITVLLFVLFASCGVQSQLNRTLNGKDLAYLENNFKQKANRVQPLENGQTKVIFVVDKTLNPTTINQGVGTLDPITSPPVKKTEYYIFLLDETGKVVDSDYEKEYERR